MNRRSMLKLLGSMPVVGPGLAQKLAGEEVSATLAGLSTSELQFPNAGPPSQGQSIGSNIDQRRIALQIPWIRQEIEQLIVEQNQQVYTLDPDLAVLRSVSLSAKICYQRQRNVQRIMKEYTKQSYWEQTETLFSKVRGILG